MTSSDFTRRFTFDGGRVRGEQVVAERAWQEILKRHAYPETLVTHLGELVAACALFASTLKTLQQDGRLTLQIQGGSPVSLLVVECGAQFDIRATARFEGEIGPSLSLREIARGARCVLTIDPGGDYEAYQSVISLQHATVSETLNAYMTLSEQLPSRFVLAANQKRAAGVLVQELPETGEGGSARPDFDPDLWNRVRALVSTLEPGELLSETADTVLDRLFLTDSTDVRIHAERPLQFRCRCSRARIEGVLKMLGDQELRGLLADQGKIDMSCDFCNERYVLTSEEAWSAFNST